MTDRQTKILEIVNQKKKVEVVTLSQMLEVSQVTIRKDLDALEELNFLTREHGYATMKNMSDISNRMAFCYETKQRIAEKASEIISDGETIMVESGSSCALLVKYLSETKKDITVITIHPILPDLSEKQRAVLQRSSFLEENIRRKQKLWWDHW